MADEPKTTPVDEPKSTKIKVGSKEYESKDLESATTLYEALQDETTGREIIETLARRAGLLKEDLKPKPGESGKKAESRIGKALKAKLGKDYEKFSDTVGPALDDIIQEMITEATGSLRGETTQDKWETSVDSFIKGHETTKEIENTMMELIQEAPPNFGRKGFDAEKYLARIYKNACEELGEEPKTKEAKGKRTRGRQADIEDEFPDVIERDAPKNATVDDAINAAMKGIRFKRA